MFNPNLLIWITLGLLINFFLLKSDSNLKGDHWFGLGFIVVLRSISGGVISNYLFSAGIWGIDASTFTVMGILPVLFLVLNKYYQRSLT